MAGTNRPPLDALAVLDELERSPHGFDFHVALRRLECAFRQHPRFGTALRLADEPIRIAQDPSMAFAPAEIAGFVPATDENPARLMVAFLGMFGPSGALPLHLTEFARDRLRNAGDATFARFVDVFHHRIFLLFQRAWTSAQPAAEHDRPDDDRFKDYVGAISGFGPRTRRGPEHLPEEVKWFYAGLFATANRSAEGLSGLLSDFFGLPVGVEEFIGEWAKLPESSRFRLCGPEETSALGRTSVVGARVRLCQERFRIVMGPLGQADFEQFLPGRGGLDRLASLVRAYAGSELAWDVRLVPAEDATDQLRLGDDRRLGWNTRLGHRKAKRIEELIVDPATRQTRRTVSSDHVRKSKREV